MTVCPAVVLGLTIMLTPTALNEESGSAAGAGADTHAADQATASVDFDTDVMPIFTKAGCNVGACHGAAAGRGEFFLSLYGSRPAADYEQITRFFGGRRISRTAPESSLLLKKATEQISHEGGTRIEFESADHTTLIRWIRQGAARSRARQLEQFQLTVQQPHLVAGESTRVTAQATFSDGTVRDVLSWTVLTADDASAVTVAADGRLTALRSGRHILTGRYLDRVRTVELLVPWDEPASLPSASSRIDQFVNVRLEQLQLSARARATDQVLLRRLYLDLTGRLPSDQDRIDFFRQPDGKRVDHLVTRLTSLSEESPTAFDRYWTWVIAQQLQLGSVPRGKAGREAIYAWLLDAVRRDEGYDGVVRRMLTASGKLSETPPAAFFEIAPGPAATAELVSRAFLGVRLQCANCHDHPLDHWKQEDYHGLSAVFAGLRIDESVKVGRGMVINPATGDPAVAMIPGGAQLPDVADPRLPLAQWLSGPENRLFARAFVNRVWARLMGRGLVEPVDDLRDTNPATHPELLTWLADDFEDNGYRLRHLVRTICLTDAYQRAATATAQRLPQHAFYTAAVPKKMAPEVYGDAVAMVLDVQRPTQISYRGLSQRQTGTTPLSSCQGPECETLTLAISDLAVQLSLLNGTPVNELLQGEGLKTLGQGTPIEVVTRLYLRALGRHPSDMEAQYWVSQLSQQKDQGSGLVDHSALQDFAWSLLTCPEFLTSH